MTEKKIDHEKLKAELDAIRATDPQGMSHAKSAVAWARNNTDSELYRHLEWDDSKAGEKYREQQVRTLFRIIVKPSPETGRTIRALVSKPSDRIHGGGYQPVEAALATGRLELVNEALKGLRQYRARYTHLPELDPLFDAVDRAVAEFVALRVKMVA